MPKHRVADPLRTWAKVFEEYAARNNGFGASLSGEDFLSIANEMRMDADEIDREHEQRMWQCEHEVRRKLCRDIRWAVNLFEDKCSRRQVRKVADGE